MLRVIDVDPFLTVSCPILILLSLKLLELDLFIFALLGFALSFLFLILGDLEIKGKNGESWKEKLPFKIYK